MNGKFRKSRNVSGTFTILTSDDVLAVDVTSAIATATLPKNPADGLTFTIKDKKKNAGTNNITVNVGSAPASTTIDQSSSDTISTNGTSRTYSYSLADNNWMII